MAHPSINRSDIRKWLDFQLHSSKDIDPEEIMLVVEPMFKMFDHGAPLLSPAGTVSLETFQTRLAVDTYLKADKLIEISLANLDATDLDLDDWDAFIHYSGALRTRNPFSADCHLENRVDTFVNELFHDHAHKMMAEFKTSVKHLRMVFGSVYNGPCELLRIYLQALLGGFPDSANKHLPTFEMLTQIAPIGELLKERGTWIILTA